MSTMSESHLRRSRRSVESELFSWSDHHDFMFLITILTIIFVLLSHATAQSFISIHHFVLYSFITMISRRSVTA